MQLDKRRHNVGTTTACRCAFTSTFPYFCARSKFVHATSDALGHILRVCPLNNLAYDDKLVTLCEIMIFSLFFQQKIFRKRSEFVNSNQKQMFVPVT